jgi:hypothetical protein
MYCQSQVDSNSYPVLHTEQLGVVEYEETFEDPDQTPPTGPEAEILAHMWSGR